MGLLGDSPLLEREVISTSIYDVAVHSAPDTRQETALVATEISHWFPALHIPNLERK